MLRRCVTLAAHPENVVWQGIYGRAAMGNLGVFAAFASFLVLAAAACVLFARVQSGAAACMALGLASFVIVAVLNNLSHIVRDSWLCGNLVVSISLWLFTIGYVLFVADHLQKRALRNPDVERPSGDRPPLLRRYASSGSDDAAEYAAAHAENVRCNGMNARYVVVVGVLCLAGCQAKTTADKNALELL